MSELTMHFIGGHLAGLQRRIDDGTDLDAACAAEGYRVELRPVIGMAEQRALCVPAEWSATEARMALLQLYGRKPEHQPKGSPETSTGTTRESRTVSRKTL